MGININLRFLPNFNITRHVMSPYNSVPFSSCPQNGVFLPVLQSVWDTLHFLYRHMYTMKMEAVVSSHFRSFHPLCGNVIEKKKEKSLHYINLQCNKDFFGKSKAKMS